jgi:hypothetical protein
MMPNMTLKPYDLMGMADRSLYQAKAAGRNGMAVACTLGAAPAHRQVDQAAGPR